MKIYTRHGDGGETGIWGGLRLAKDEARLEAIGTVDELNAAIGFAAAAVRESPYKRQDQRTRQQCERRHSDLPAAPAKFGSQGLDEKADDQGEHV